MASPTDMPDKFVVYMTPSRVVWYETMRNQVLIAYRGVLGILTSQALIDL